MKKRGIYSFLAAAAGLLLIFGFSSCTRDAAQQGEVCFTIPQEVFQQIAARAVTDDKEIDKTSEAEILTVPDDDNLTFEISLWEKSGKKIDSQSASKTFKKWLEASANNDIKFSFQNITVGKTIYATASATAVINGETREICSSVSDPALITQGTNYIPLELTFTVVDNKNDDGDDDGDDDKIKFDITISTDADLTDQKIGAVSLFCVDAEYADENGFFTKKSGSDTLEISNENIIKLIDNAGDLIETTSGKMVSNLPNTTTIFCSPIATLYSARDEGIIDNGNGKISVNYSTSSYGTIVSDKPVYIIALVTYSEADKTVLPEENHNYVKTQLSSYWRGITKLENISQTELNKVELSINQTGIPCRILIMYGPWDEDLQMTAYTSVSVEGANKMVTDNYKTIGEADLKAIFPDFDFSTYIYNGLSATPESADGINYGSCAYLHAQGRLEGMNFDAGGQINTIEPVTNILNITATPSEQFYLNTGSVSLSAKKSFTEEDLSSSSDIIWNAKLLYGGVDINDYGIEYYTLFRDGNNKWSVELTDNKLETGGTYQLYVTATYKGATSSQMLDVEVEDSLLYEYNLSNPDDDTFDEFMTQFQDDLSKLSAQATFVISGSLNSDPDTADEQFESLLSSIRYLYPEYSFSLDMSAFSGGSELSQDYYISSAKLASIVLPNTITTLESRAFNECPQLKSITLPGTIETIEGGAFYKCSSLEEIKLTSENSSYCTDSSGSLCKIEGNDKILLYPSSTFLTNPNFASAGITKIGEFAFQDVTISGPLDLTGITSFEASSFQYAKIASIASFGSITEIPANAFKYAEFTGSINFEGLSVGEYAFYQAKSSQPLDFTGIVSLGENAFTYASIPAITSFGNLTTVPKSAFQSCEGLTTVNLAGIVTVGEAAFYGCDDLTTIENYENLQAIELSGFRNCYDLSRFTIKEGLSLGKWAFSDTWIDELIIDIEITADNAATIKEDYFSYIDDEGRTQGKLNRAKHIIFNRKAVIPDLDATFSETNLPENTYKNTDSFLYPFTESSNAKNNLQSIEFKVADSSIGNNQFINYKQLTEIKTNGNVTLIGNFAFYGCTNLTTVDIDITDDAVEVGTKAFENTGLN